MIEVIIQRAAVNIEALDTALRAALGNVATGISVGGGQVKLHLTDDATPAQVDTARALAVAHVPTDLTPAQQAALIRRQKLDQARRDYGASEIDLTVYAGQNALLVALAQKIAWLERELAALRSQ
jgi:hypothetical protein